MARCCLTTFSENGVLQGLGDGGDERSPASGRETGTRESHAPLKKIGMNRIGP